jgi:hypothetical protein
MNTALGLFLITVVLLASFGLVAALAPRSHANSYLRRHLGHFRLATPAVGYLFDDRDSDGRRIDHDTDAIRTRFEEHPAWPSSGSRDERR